MTNAELSKRPRYAQINDLKSRNGQGSFLELVPARVADVSRGEDGKLQLIQQDGQPVLAGQNGDKRPIKADHVIAASGFRPMLDEVFKDLLVDGESLNERRGTERVSLPSNPGFGIADTLLKDNDVLIVGTASRADFTNSNKLGQLPPSAREALLRNGSENAVAIGFRTPDTRAAIRRQFEGKDITRMADIQKVSRNRLIDISKGTRANSIPVSIDMGRLPQTRRDVEADSDTLSALFLSAVPSLRLSDSTELLSPIDSRATQQYTARVLFDTNSDTFIVNGEQAYPDQLGEVIAEAVSDPYFQAYALKALRGRRTNRGLELSLAFRRGRLQYRDPGQREGRGRTYIEVL